MSTHIFIATTQGLVAVQNITAIDDEDISSVVSVNGTSTTANISGSYHNFVKKGVGIIQQVFGACSYRVDISARIDQGNSWQVAMYLAHLAHSRNILGDGDVQKGDSVICATGEVNTTNHKVLAVGKVATKYKLAQPQLKQWTALGAKVKFLLPLANQADITKEAQIKSSDLNGDSIQLISHLKEAATCIPSCYNDKAKGTARNTDSDQKSVSINLRHIVVLLIFAFVLLIGWAITHLSTSTGQLQPTSTKNNNNSDLNNEELSEPEIELVAHINNDKHDKNCTQISARLIALNQHNFADLSLKKLCDLTVQPHSSQAQLLLIAQDANTVLPLQKRPQGWQIPLPKNRTADRSYFLVIMTDKLTDEKIEQLRLYREKMATPKMLSEPLLSAWLTKHNVNFTLYTHKLLRD